jgi:hypothetical protein
MRYDLPPCGDGFIAEPALVDPRIQMVGRQPGCSDVR